MDFLEVIPELVGIQLVGDSGRYLDELEDDVAIHGNIPEFLTVSRSHKRSFTGYKVVNDANAAQLMQAVLGGKSLSEENLDEKCFDEEQITEIIVRFCGFKESEPLVGLPTMPARILLPAKTTAGYIFVCVGIEDDGVIILSFSLIESNTLKWLALHEHCLMVPRD